MSETMFAKPMNSLIILGPTAVGKSKLAVELAKQINAEIISADSMQVYRGMDIGTAKPTMEERQGIPHHLIDIRNPDESWTVSDFIEQVNRITNPLSALPLNKGEMSEGQKGYIIVGGTGLYLWALLEGFSFPITPADKELRARLENEPTSALYVRLSTIDPKAAAKIHENDKKRIIRALEVYELTGKPISELQKKRGADPPHLSVGNQNPLLIGLNLPRDELYLRINQRVEDMLAKGLIDEVKGLLAKGYSRGLFSFQALGYKEVAEHLDGKWAKEQMIEELKKRTRNFARRQMTWFRRFHNVRWFHPDEKDAIIKLCHGPENRK